MYYDYVSETLEKYIMKMLSINLSYTKEFEKLLINSNMAYSDMMTSTTKQSFIRLLWILTNVLNFVWTTYICTYIITGWLPGDSGTDSSQVARLDDYN